MPNPSNSPNPLKRLRSQLGLSQVQVAAKVGVSQPNYQRWEAGAAPIPKDKIKKLARILHSTPDVLSGAARYARASLAIMSDAEGYWGTAAVHFTSGSKPVVVCISASERDRIEEEMTSEFTNCEFIEVSGMCNEHYVIRRSAISELYLSDEGADCAGAVDEDYDFLPIQIVDDRLWDVLSRYNQEVDFEEGDFPLDDIVEALSCFMRCFEIAEFVSALPHGAAASKRIGPEDAVKLVAQKTGVPEDAILAEDREENEDLAFHREFLLSRASDTVVRIGPSVERRFVLQDPEDLTNNHGKLTGLALSQHDVLSFAVAGGQIGLFRSDAIEFVRFPKHYLARALDGVDMNVLGTAGVEEGD